MNNMNLAFPSYSGDLLSEFLHNSAEENYALLWALL